MQPPMFAASANVGNAGERSASVRRSASASAGRERVASPCSPLTSPVLKAARTDAAPIAPPSIGASPTDSADAGPAVPLGRPTNVRGSLSSLYGAE